PTLVACKKLPARWIDFREGVYWTRNSLLSAPFVRTHDQVVERAICKAIADGTIRPHMDAASAQQSVPWQIDEQMLDITKRLGPYRLAKEPGSFKCRRDRYGKWVKRRELDDSSLWLADLSAAERLRGEAFYNPKNVDARGRFYSIPSFNFE